MHNYTKINELLIKNLTTYMKDVHKYYTKWYLHFRDFNVQLRLFSSIRNKKLEKNLHF